MQRLTTGQGAENKHLSSAQPSIPQVGHLYHTPSLRLRDCFGRKLVRARGHKDQSETVSSEHEKATEFIPSVTACADMHKIKPISFKHGEERSSLAFIPTWELWTADSFYWYRASQFSLKIRQVEYQPHSSGWLHTGMYMDSTS